MRDSRFALYELAVTRRLNVPLTQHFRLKELVDSPLADKRGIDNWPKSADVVWRLHHLAFHILQRVRNHYGRPIHITSGYRSPDLNCAVGGSDKSDHCHGFAADFEVAGRDNREVARWIAQNCQYKQLILEFYQSDAGLHSGWIHASYSPEGCNRRDFKVARKGPKGTCYYPATVHLLNSL